jgi:hypothetical protein
VKRLLLLVAIASCARPSLVWTGRTPDRRHAIAIRHEAGLDNVLVDGKRRAAYRGIAGWSVAVAQDHLAFAAKLGKQWAVVRDGRVSRERWDGIGELRFTGDTLVYIAERAGGWHVVANDVVGPRHGAILAATLRTAGTHVAYVAQDGPRSRVVVDGHAHPVFDGIAQLELRADGRSAYVARAGLDMHAVIDGVVSPARSRISHVTLGPGRRAAYAATIEGEARLVVDDAIGPGVDEIRLVRWSDDGAQVAWLGRLGALDILSLDDAPIAAWPKRADAKVAFKPGTHELAYVATVEGGERMIANGISGPIFDEVRAPIWRNDTVTYVAMRAGKWLVVDGTRELDAGDAVGDPIVTSTRLAFGGRRGKRHYVTVDGNTFTYDLVFTDTVAFSRDGKRWGALVGDLAKEQLYIVVDGARRAAVPVAEIYSAGAAGKDNALIEWTRAELER